MKWIKLILAGIFEMSYIVSINYSKEFTKPVPSVITSFGYVASAIFLSMD